MTETRKVMNDFHKTGLSRPIFATTTPANLIFTVKTLLEHLIAQRRNDRA